MKLLLKKGTSIESMDTSNNTLLYLAVQSYNSSTVNTVELLLENGASIEAMDKGNDTPLHLAIQNHTSPVELILEIGASINFMNKAVFHCILPYGVVLLV